jgi:hypothetical protein
MDINEYLRVACANHSVSVLHVFEKTLSITAIRRSYQYSLPLEILVDLVDVPSVVQLFDVLFRLL